MAEQDTERHDPNEPLYDVHYELDSSMCEEAASLLGGSSTKNVAYLASGCFLLVIIFILTMPDTNTNLAIVFAIVAALLWNLGSQWRKVMLRRLRKHGLDPVMSTKEANRREVEVYDSSLVERFADDSQTDRPLSTIAKVQTSERICLLRFQGGDLVIIPRSAMSLGRFNSMTSFLSEKAK